MRVFLNPGHDLVYDSGAVHPATGLRECEVAAAVGDLVKGYLEDAGCEVRMMQSDNLAWDSPYEDRQDCSVCDCANEWTADVFVSIHCNAANGRARGTETLICGAGGRAEQLAECIQRQIVESLGTMDRGLKERPGLIVLRATDMPAVLVELAFIDNDEDAELLMTRQDDFARAIARGVTDYELLL
jgi:N-acetylmuramoyl-L-alanine amidase